MKFQNFNERQAWAIKLFKKSPLKQKKFQMLQRFIPADVLDKKCLDIGSDNGVISLLLRSSSGGWTSVDLIPETVESIKALVKDNVYQIQDGRLPLEDKSFNCVVVIDMLEHVEDDKLFVSEVYRVLKDDGYAIFNVPNPKNGFIRKIQYKLGQTDEAHGHLRSGYTPEALEQLLKDNFKILKQDSYSRFFSVAVDTFLTFILDRFKKGGRSKKGTVVTQDDLNKLKKSFKLYSLIYPFIAFMVKLDDIFFFTHGNMLITLCHKIPNYND